jgi:acyl carrier protein
MFATIQRIIEQEARLAIPAAHLTPRADLYALGLTSFDAVRLVVAIERAFKVEFPREALKRETVASIEAIARTLEAMRSAPEARELRAAA